MKTYRTYQEAYNAAVAKADSLKMEVGLSKERDFGSVVWTIRLLPKPENRRGSELTCEVVRPGQPIQTNA